MGSSEELSHSSAGTCSYSNTDNETCKYSSSFSSKSSGKVFIRLLTTNID